MPVTLEQVAAEASMLSVHDRQKLLLRLMREFDLAEKSLSREEIDHAWDAEVARRLDEIDSGKVKTIPGSEVFARIQAKLNEGG